MIYNFSNDIKIEYNDCDIKYINDIIDYLKDYIPKIFEFFKLNCINHNLVIKIIPSVKEYTIIRNGNLNPSSVGNGHYNKEKNMYEIFVLSYDALKTRYGHSNDSEDHLKKLITHEFVHICEFATGYYKQEKNSNLLWIVEGLACTLSGQYTNLEYKITCSLEDLLNNKQTYYINYYTLIDYTLNKYGKEYVYNLFINKEFALHETKKIYDELLHDKIKGVDFHERK